MAVKDQAKAKQGHVFGTPLEALMDKQKEKYSQLDVPRVLLALIDAVFRLNASKVEGIFRLSAGAEELKIVKERLDEGNYDVMTGTTSVHVPCALIKLWMRELPEPLIPNSL